MNKVEEEILNILWEDIKSHRENCYCNLDKVCDNCKSKESIIELSKKIKEVIEKGELTK